MLLRCSDPISTASMDAKVTNWNYPAIMNMCLLLASLAFATTFIVAKMKKYVCGLGYSHGLHLGGRLKRTTSIILTFPIRYFGPCFARTGNDPRIPRTTVSYAIRVAGLLMSHSCELTLSKLQRTREDFVGSVVCSFFRGVDARFYRCFLLLQGEVSALPTRCSQWPQACARSVAALMATFCGHIRTLIWLVQWCMLCLLTLVTRLGCCLFHMTWGGFAFLMQGAQWSWACVRSVATRLAAFDVFTQKLDGLGVYSLCAKFIYLCYNQPLYLFASIAESGYAFLRAQWPPRPGRGVHIVHSNGVCGTYSGYGRGAVKISASSVGGGTSFFSGDRLTGPSKIISKKVYQPATRMACTVSACCARSW